MSKDGPVFVAADQVSDLINVLSETLPGVFDAHGHVLLDAIQMKGVINGLMICLVMLACIAAIVLSRKYILNESNYTPRESDIETYGERWVQSRMREARRIHRVMGYGIPGFVMSMLAVPLFYSILAIVDPVSWFVLKLL